MNKVDAITLSQKAVRVISSFASEEGGTHLVEVCDKVKSRFVSAFLRYEIGDEFCKDLNAWFESEVEKVDHKTKQRVKNVFNELKKELGPLIKNPGVRPAQKKTVKKLTVPTVCFEDLPRGWGNETDLLKAFGLATLEDLYEYVPVIALKEFTGPHYSGEGLMYDLGKIYAIYIEERDVKK